MYSARNMMARPFTLARRFSYVLMIVAALLPVPTASLTVAHAASGTVRYVATPIMGGSDANDCAFPTVRGDRSGPCATIQNAINKSSDGDGIIVEPGIYTETLTITPSVAITGMAGATQTIVDGNAAGSVATVPLVTDTVSLNGLTLRNGNSGGDGGGIYNNRTVVTLSNTVVMSNAATGNGGGIRNDGPAFIGAVAPPASTHAHAFTRPQDLSPGTTAVTSSPVVSNTAGNDGGGIYNTLGGLVTLQDSTVATNTATDGGGVYNDGTGTLPFFVSGSTVTLASSAIVSNTATGNGKSGGSGGGLYNNLSAAMLDAASTVVTNTASADGGGIFNTGGDVTLTGASVLSNTAASGGGLYNSLATAMIFTFMGSSTATFSGTLELTGGTVANNAVTGPGGGIENGISSTVSMTTSTVGANTVSLNGSMGGGIDNSGLLSVISSTLAGNSIGAFGGGAGGGIENGISGTVDLTASTIADNSSGLFGGRGGGESTTAARSA